MSLTWQKSLMSWPIKADTVRWSMLKPLSTQPHIQLGLRLIKHVSSSFTQLSLLCSIQMYTVSSQKLENSLDSRGLRLWVEDDASARPPNLSSASYDLGVWSPDPKIDHFMPLLHGQLVLTGVKICSIFVIKISHSQVQTDNKQTHKRTAEIIVPPSAGLRHHLCKTF